MQYGESRELYHVHLVSLNWFFMLNSAQHDIWSASKSQITKLFLAKQSLAWKFDILGLNIDEYERFSANKYENANNSWHFHIY